MGWRCDVCGEDDYHDHTECRKYTEMKELEQSRLSIEEDNFNEITERLDEIVELIKEISMKMDKERK